MIRAQPARAGRCRRVRFGSARLAIDAGYEPKREELAGEGEAIHLCAMDADHPATRIRDGRTLPEGANQRRRLGRHLDELAGLGSSDDPPVPLLAHQQGMQGEPRVRPELSRVSRSRSHGAGIQR